MPRLRGSPSAGSYQSCLPSTHSTPTPSGARRTYVAAVGRVRSRSGSSVRCRGVEQPDHRSWSRP